MCDLNAIRIRRQLAPPQTRPPYPGLPAHIAHMGICLGYQPGLLPVTSNGLQSIGARVSGPGSPNPGAPNRMHGPFVKDIYSSTVVLPIRSSGLVVRVDADAEGAHQLHAAKRGENRKGRPIRRLGAWQAKPRSHAVCRRWVGVTQ